MPGSIELRRWRRTLNQLRHRWVDHQLFANRADGAFSGLTNVVDAGGGGNCLEL